MPSPSQLRALVLGGLAAVFGCTAHERSADQPKAAVGGGIVPPRSSVDVLPLEGLTIEVPPTALIVVDGVTRISPAFRDELVSQSEARERTVGNMAGGHILVLADRDMPSSALGDILFAATRTGVTSYSLLVNAEQQRRSLPIYVPSTSFFGQSLESERARRLDIVFTIHRDAIEARVAGEGEHRFPGHDFAAIAAFALQTKRAHPKEEIVTMRVDGDVTLQALVSVIDAVRGDGCLLHRAFMAVERIPGGCLLVAPIVEVATRAP